MAYWMYLLGEPKADRSAPVLEKRMQGGETLDEAINIAKADVRDYPSPGTRGFFLLDEQGKEVCRWFAGDDQV
jgi:hypothetical protein